MPSNTEAFDYRESHVNEGRGSAYDRLYRRGGALAFYWEHFERPYLDEMFSKVRRRYHGGRYLDFACGTGRILKVGAGHFADATGIDVSDEMLVKARHKAPGARVIRADVLADPIDVGKFDVVTLFRFLLRAGKLREPVLGWLRGVIKDGGTLIVNNHRNAYSLRGMAYRVATTLRPNGFENDLLTDSEMKSLLERSGFTIVERYSFGVVPSFNGRMLLPPSLVLAFERLARRNGLLGGVAKNRIYVCHPRSRTR